MKAAVVCANEDVQYLDYEEPTPGPGEVKVKVKCSGICGSDIPRVLHNGVHFYPIVLGHEFSGDVVEVGEGVTKVKVGDHVSGAPLKPCMKCDDCQNGNFSLCKHYSFIGSREQGSNADYVVIPEQNAVVYEIPFRCVDNFVSSKTFRKFKSLITDVENYNFLGSEDLAPLHCEHSDRSAAEYCNILSALIIILEHSVDRYSCRLKHGRLFIRNVHNAVVQDLRIQESCSFRHQ